MTALSRTDKHLRLALTVAGIVLLGTVAAGLLTSSRGPFPFGPYLVAPFFVVPAYLIAGWIAWERRPDSRIGLLLLIAGVLYAAGSLSPVDIAPIFTIAWLLGNYYQNVLGQMLLAFPSGRLQNTWERVIVIGFYVSGTLGGPVAMMFRDPLLACPCRLPSNVAMIASAPGVADTLESTTSVAAVVLITAFVVVLVRHWRAAAPSMKRALALVYWGGALGGVLALGAAINDAIGASFTDTAAWGWLDVTVTFVFPLLFLFGLLRLRRTRGALGDLVVELGTGAELEEGLRDALARRLGDPTLALRYRLADQSWVDDAGRPVAEPASTDDRSVLLLESDGEPFAALDIDARLQEVPELIDAVVAAARLAIANDRLRAQVRAQLEEVQASRRRIVEAADAARRKVERDLHDGAQQRLVGLSLGLRMLQDRMSEAEELQSQIDGLQAELRAALAELRELARGLHPQILTEEGLGAAVESLADRSPFPVSVTFDVDERYPAPVEATAYFVVSEALTNVAKYANATTATVRLARSNGSLMIEVSDDGVGGASIGAGSGLTGLLDRVSALGGTMQVDSPAEGGTRLNAEIPAT
jgi:signal transduction histidine kinase